MEKCVWMIICLDEPGDFTQDSPELHSSEKSAKKVCKKRTEEDPDGYEWVVSKIPVLD